MAAAVRVGNRCTGALTPQPPGGAYDLTAEYNENGVNLSWTAPADGGTVTGYRILLRLPDRGEKQFGMLVENTGSAATSYVDQTASAGTKHIYRVQALNAAGEGQSSKPAEIVVPQH